MVGASCSKASETRTATGDLSYVAARGVLWSGAGTIWRLIVQVTTTLLLAHLLAPEIFGLLAMTTVFIEIAQLFVDFGLGLAVIQARDIPSVLLSSCFWLSSGVATAVALLLSAAAPAIATVYGEPRITMLVPFLSLSLAISGAVAMPYALLQRAMRFAAFAKIRLVGSVVGSAIAIALAARGFGVWSLVAQPLAGSSVAAALVFKATGWRPRLEFSWHSLRGVIRFSSALFGTNLLNYCNRNGDNFLIGRFLGAGPLGYYTMAYQLMLFPLGQVSIAIGRVIYPILAGLQHDLARYRRYYLRSCAAIAFVSFPMMCGLFVVADQFVMTVLGHKWLGAVIVLKVLCPVGMLQSIGTTVGAIYNSTGRTRTGFLWTLVATPLTLAAFGVGLIWGIEGVAICYATVSSVLTFISFRIAFGIVELTMRSLTATLWRPLACAVLMAAGMYGLDRVVLAGNAAGLLRLGCDITFGLILYSLLSVKLNEYDLKEFTEKIISVLAPGRIRSKGNQTPI